MRGARWGLVRFLVWCFDLFACAALGWRYPGPVLVIGCEQAMQASQVEARLGDQGNQAGNEIQRFE